MGCAGSVPQRLDAPKSGELTYARGTTALGSVQSVPSQENFMTSTIDVELPSLSSIPEQGDAATSSRLRARTSRTSNSDLMHQGQLSSVNEQGPELPNMLNTKSDRTVTSVDWHGSRRATASAPQSQDQRQQLSAVLPIISEAFQQPEQKLAATQQSAFFGGSFQQHHALAAAGVVVQPQPQSQPQLQQPLPQSPSQQQQPQRDVTLQRDVMAVAQQMIGMEVESLLARASATPVPAPVTDGRKLVLLVWDIEHVRCPEGNGRGKQAWKHPLSPQNVLGYLKQHFIYGAAGRIEYRTVAALSESSLRNILKHHPHFVELAVPNLSLFLAAKGTATMVLEKEVRGFMAQHAHIACRSPGQLTVALVAREDHFLEVRQEAVDAGFAVELLPQRQWIDFLRRQSCQRTVKLVK